MYSFVVRTGPLRRPLPVQSFGRGLRARDCRQGRDAQPGRLASLVGVRVPWRGPRLAIRQGDLSRPQPRAR